MKILSELEYVDKNRNSLMEYATSGSFLNILGKINFINDKPKDTTTPFQFAEITLNLKNASIVYPNILISEKKRYYKCK